LRAIETQASEEDYEIIVVNNGSEEPNRTTEVVKDCRAAREVRLERASLAAARNLGASASSGQILVFLDDDMRVVEGSLRLLVRRCTLEGCWVMGALDLPAGYRPTPFDSWKFSGGGWHVVRSRHRLAVLDVVLKAREDQVSREIAGTAVAREAAVVEWFRGGFLAVPRPLFDELGGEDERLSGIGMVDMDLELRARGAGHRILLEPAARAIHEDYSLGSLRATCLRTRVHARAWVVMALIHPEYPTAVMVAKNSPPAAGDGVPLLIEKTVRAVLGSERCGSFLVALAEATEHLTSSLLILAPMYRLSQIGAINRGIREGLRDQQRVVSAT
jgi:GT2 family glycosyltransferase